MQWNDAQGSGGKTARWVGAACLPPRSPGSKGCTTQGARWHRQTSNQMPFPLPGFQRHSAPLIKPAWESNTGSFRKARAQNHSASIANIYCFACPHNFWCESWTATEVGQKKGKEATAGSCLSIEIPEEGFSSESWSLHEGSDSIYGRTKKLTKPFLGWDKTQRGKFKKTEGEV